MANESPYFWTCQKCRYRNSKLAQQCFSCRNRNPNEQITKKSTLPSSSSKTSTTLLNDQHHRRSYVTNNNNNNVLTTKIKNQQIRTNQLLPTTKRSSQTTTALTTNQNTRIIPIQISQQKQQNSYIKSNPKTLATIQETTKSTNNQQPQPQQSNQMSEVFESFRRNVRRKMYVRFLFFNRIFDCFFSRMNFLKIYFFFFVFSFVLLLFMLLGCFCFIGIFIQPMMVIVHRYIHVGVNPVKNYRQKHIY